MVRAVKRRTSCCGVCGWRMSLTTIVAVAHRLSTVFDADRIWVMESGAVCEEGSPAETVGVLRCEAPNLVVVRIGPDGWVVTVRIEGDDDEVTISLEQDIADAESASDIGPGWDFYLDRLVEAEAGRDPEALRFSPDYHPALADHYRALLRG